MYKNYVLKKARSKVYGGDKIEEIPLSKLVENPYQPRIEIKKEEVEELANSIKENGLLQPILVHKNDDNSYTIIAGHRRTKAHKLLGEKFIKAIVLKNQKFIQFAKKSIIENLQREELDLIETAIALKRYKEEFKKTDEEIGKEIGKSRIYVTRILNILNLPNEIIKDIKENKSTKDITSLNLLNSYAKKLNVRMRTISTIEKKENIKNEIIELYQQFLVNGREWLKKEIDERLKKENKKDIKINFGKNKTKIEINFKLNSDEIELLQEYLKQIANKRDVEIELKK